MKFLLSILTVFITAGQIAKGDNMNVVCFYDTSSIMRGGTANFTINDLQTSLQLCTHVVYGYVGIRDESYDVVTMDSRQIPIFEQVRQLKKKFPNVKFLLSLGGNGDLRKVEKYYGLLNADIGKQQAFAKSAQSLVRNYQFDGLDLAYQLPSEKVMKQRSKFVGTWNKIQNAVTSKVSSNLGLNKKNKKPHQEKVKAQMSQLIRELRRTFSENKLMLTLTVLPNVNASKFYDVRSIIGNVDLVNLAAFDFSTPHRTPKVADYLAPLKAPPKNKVRNPQANVDSQIQYWLSQGANSKQLILGIPAYGRTWQIKKVLKSDRFPIVSSLDGPASGDSGTHKRGLWSWSEVCKNVKTMTNVEDKTFGNYAYRGMEIKGANGLMVTYENVASVTEKASHAQNRGLGGMALFDLSLDDFRGECTGDKFPLLKTIRYKLL
ncbi:chitinase-like protein Idgf3 [Haematobia irritans]|uniref:chitinase-like protein Idgf3 n=1 Tax=Haematobia irritans TaxID=7368 RepID=UPI003F4FD868